MDRKKSIWGSFKDWDKNELVLRRTNEKKQTEPQIKKTGMV